ncbi:hypothetical protein T03_1798 [Trichinella britovi]|uniref:Uncharacterized protein n=1 Tax=Trichinella britovi TaxID=45882 RepID=A0A0V1CEM8_TRIBR|nr:hypothetical protein T03_1798 [Trichinella britovi]
MAMEQRKCENTDDTMQNKRRQEVNAISCDSVKQGYGYFERVKLFLSLMKLPKMVQRKCENTDGTKQNKRRQEVNAISCGSVKQG